MKHLAFVFLGGGIGSVLRYLVGRWINVFKIFPFTTFTVNVLGSFFIGLLLGYTLKLSNINNEIHLFFVVGFCGGFTTFSTFAYENLNYLKTGHYKLFVLYSSCSILFSIVAVFLGFCASK